MDINDYLTAKAEMESEIRSAVIAAIAKFRGATQYTPRAIDVNLVDVTLVGDVRPQRVVGQVKTDVDIG